MDSDFNTLKKIMPLKLPNVNRTTNFPIKQTSRYNDNISFFMPYGNQIYSINQNRITDSYKLQHEHLKSITPDKKKVSVTPSETNDLFAIDFFKETTDLFCIQYPFGEGFYTSIYFKKNNYTLNFDNSEVIYNTSKYYFPFPLIKYAIGNSLYCVLDTDLLLMLKYYPENYNIINNNLLEVIKRIDSNSNPLIMKIKFK